jgi:hypothetical protein
VEEVKPPPYKHEKLKIKEHVLFFTGAALI